MYLIITTILLFSSVIVSGQYPPPTTDDIKSLRRELFVTRGYDRYARPIPPRDQLRVNIRYSLVHLRDMDLKSQTITVDGWLFHDWHDPALVWEQTQWKNIEILHVPSDQIYIPDIMAYNGIDFTTKKRADTNAIVSSKGLVIWVPPITTKASCRLELSRWPYDEHMCKLKFGSWTFNGYLMDVKAMTNSKDFLSDFFKSSEFEVEFVKVMNNNTYYDCCKEPYPSVVYVFKLKRRPTLYHCIISIPAVVAIILSLVSFWLPIRSNTRFVLTGISLLVLTLLLIYFGSQLGFSSFGTPIAVRFLSATTLMIGIMQIWFIVAYNFSLVKCQTPTWTGRITKPLVQMFKHSEVETIVLTQTEVPDVSRKSSPTAEELVFAVDKISFFLFLIAIIITGLA